MTKDFNILEELSQLKEDYSALKEELGKQKIINSEIMEATFKKNIRTIKSDKKLTLIVAAVAIPVTIIMGIMRNVLWSISLPASLFILVSVTVTLIFYRKYDIDRIMSEDVLSSAKGLLQFKKAYAIMSWILLFVAVVFIMSFAPKIYLSWSTPIKGICAVALLIIILAVTISMQIAFDKKILKACDEIITRLKIDE